MNAERHEATGEDIRSLAAKLESLELNPIEAQLLDDVLARAEFAAAADDSADVQGFGAVRPPTTTFKGTDEELQFSPMGRRLGQALGFHIHVNPFIGETEKN